MRELNEMQREFEKSKFEKESLEKTLRDVNSKMQD